MIKRTLILGGLVLAAIAGFVGCGSGDKNGESTTTTTTAASTGIAIPFWPNGQPKSIGKALYLKRANNVCQRGRNQMPRSFEGRYRHVNRGKIYTEATANIFLPGVQLWFDDIAYLGAPPGDQAQVEKLLTAMQRAVYASEAQHIDFSGQLIAQFAESNRLVRRYGLDSCLVEGAPFATS